MPILLFVVACFLNYSIFVQGQGRVIVKLVGVKEVSSRWGIGRRFILKLIILGLCRLILGTHMDYVQKN